MNDLSNSFRENLYKFLAAYIKQHGTSPLFAEITAGLGISSKSKSLITRNLRALQKEGKVRLIKEGRKLLIKLTSKEIPLMGRISAGVPIEAISEYNFIDVDQLFCGEHRFALQVKGTSMIDEGIMDGDIIICKKTSLAKEGDIVVALIDNENAALKRISYKISSMITLVPANNDLKPQIYLPERIQIQGLYIGIIRMHTLRSDYAMAARNYFD